MKEILKTYTLVLTCDSPVFIGSEKSLMRKEYIFEKNKVYIPNLPVMFEELRKMHLDASFENYLLGGGGQPLSEWLKKNKVKPSVWQKWTSYSVDFQSANWEYLDINPFVKDAYGNPYVPGSSVKGLLRTVLMARKLQDNPSDFQTVQQDVIKNASKNNRKNCLKDEAKTLEVQSFHQLKRNEKRRYDAVNDVLCGIRIGDSEPLKTSDLTLCQKIDIDKDGKRNALPLLRESLKPGTVIRLPMTIDTEICKETPESILRAVTSFGECYDECFRKKFRGCGQLRPNNVWLGGGCGFFTKTEVYPLLGEKNGVRVTSDIFRTTLGRNFDRHKHGGDIARGVSPHTMKFTLYGGKLYEIGKCRIDIQ